MTETAAGISVNVNARVEVMLTESGLRRINCYNDSLFPASSAIRKFARHQTGKRWEGQLWELMMIWGPEMYMGNPNHPLFEENKVRFL